MKKLVLYGAGGLGREAVLLVDEINYTHPGTYNLLGFVVDSQYLRGQQKVAGYPVLGDAKWLFDHANEVCCAITVGDYSEERERIFRTLEAENIEIESLISPSVYVHSSNTIGRGCYIGWRTTLSVDMVIGNGVFINSDCMFGHDVHVGDFASVMPRAAISGGCTIGKHAVIGGGSYILPRSCFSLSL